MSVKREELKNETTIYLDIDGVVAKLYETIAGRLKEKESEKNWSKWVRKLHESERLEKKSFWESFTEEKEEFYEEMEAYPWTKDLFKELKELAPTLFLSSPTPDTTSGGGKLKWLEKH